MEETETKYRCRACGYVTTKPNEKPGEPGWLTCEDYFCGGTVDKLKERIMKEFTLENKPNDMQAYRKTATVQLHFVTEPFTVITQEGALTINEQTEGWEGGYNVAYPSDGTKPYPMSPEFARKNYVAV